MKIAGHVYLIQDPLRRDRVKIGYARDLGKRLKSFRAHNHDIELLASLSTDDMHKLERSLHAKYRRERLVFAGVQSTEWFRYTDKIAREFGLEV
jgi:hypothetical protein